MFRTMNEFIKLFGVYGLPTVCLIVFLFLIVQDPTRGEKLQALVTKPFYRMCRWFSKTHISSEVSSSLNMFYNNKIFNLLVDKNKPQIKIKWVTESEDPAFTKEGNIILRLKEEKDQTRNILNAAKFSLPLIICPLVRSNIHHSYSTALDLTLMKKLSNNMGRHGKAIFKQYFLDPETSQDKTLGVLIQRLVELDNHGFFIPVVLNELEIIGEGLYADSNPNDYTSEAIKFLEYLLEIVNRKIGDEIELNYTEKPFSVGTMLLAKSHRADTQGLRPYLKRLQIKIDKGIQSIYIISFPNSYVFFDKLIKTLRSHESLNIEKLINTVDYTINETNKKTNFKIAIISSNNIFSNDSFKERIITNNIEEGKRYEGTVEDVSEKEALINLHGLRAYIKYRNCSWNYPTSCKDFLELNKEYEFEVETIEWETGTIFLSRKFLELDPWALKTPPSNGDEIKIKVYSKLNNRLLCFYDEKLPVLLPITELSWQPNNIDSEVIDLIGTELIVEVIQVDTDKKEIIVSKRELVTDPWPDIHTAYPIGKEIHGKVCEIQEHYVKVKIDESIIAILPKESLQKAGYEYSDFQNNLVVDQGLDLFVSKVFIAKKKMRVDLRRNKNAP
ncbi:S1 RNA-binding domain-containing protein [Nonlabens sp. Ci31]|nr:S1 RNA-binding domain-containing protein [Nonlabens sp. Ci31]